MNEWVSYRNTGNYNNFLLLASPDGDYRTIADVMAVWQLNFSGKVYVVYGQMSMEGSPAVSDGQCADDTLLCLNPADA